MAPSLVDAARRGDRRALAALFEEYGPTVHGILLARVPPREADDLMQDVLVTALEKIATLRDEASFGAWLCAIARNRATDWLRTRKPTVELTDEMGARAAGGARAEAEQVLAAIRALPDAYRETLMLRLVEGLTGPEIAARVGLTPESVRVNLHRGMKLLREQLGD
jgi:RNA polymerase sigma-70 factor (ECF subfamily)